MNIGKYVFAQAIDLIPRYQFDKLVEKLATLIRSSAFERIDLRDLITKPKDSSIQKQTVNERSLFDDL